MQAITSSSGSSGHGRLSTVPVYGTPFQRFEQMPRSRHMQSPPHSLAHRPPPPPAEGPRFVVVVVGLGMVEVCVWGEGAVLVSAIEVVEGLIEEMEVAGIVFGAMSSEVARMESPWLEVAVHVFLDLLVAPRLPPMPAPRATRTDRIQAMMRNVRLLRPSILASSYRPLLHVSLTWS